MLEVREQVRLSFKRMLAICLDSISYRLLRSLVTVVIIVLAIAFLASIMVEGYLGRSLRDAVRAETRKLTAYSRFLREASYVVPDAKLVSALAALRTDSAGERNLTGWLAASADKTRAFLDDSRRAQAYLDFFQDMPRGKRVLLVQEHEGLAVFDWLGASRNQELVAARLRRMKSVRLPGEPGDLDAFLAAWPAYRKQLGRVRQNYVATVARISAFCGEKGLGGKLSEAVADGTSAALFARLAEMGFHLDKALEPLVLAGQEYRQRVAWAVGHLRKSPVRTGWNRKFQEKFSPLQALTSCARWPGRLDWIERTLREKGGDDFGDFDRAKVLAIARSYRRQRELLEAEQRLLNRYGETGRLSEKTLWLIFVSFLVCVVGIANAMLMSVLERFKEIATMKCLGARNQTIAFLFVTESTIMGVIGGLIGMAVGFLIVFVRQAATYGGLLFRGFPVGDMLTTLAVCFACSLVLASVAAIYPARVAARMAPMEAMRVD